MLALSSRGKAAAGKGCGLRLSALVVGSALLIGVVESGAAGRTSQPFSAHASNSPLLAVLRPSSIGGSQLARLDAATLEPLRGRRVALGRNTGAFDFSPDGRKLAIGVDRALGVRFVDVRGMRRVADVEMRNGDVLALAWLTPRRVVALDRVGVSVIDPVTHRLVAFRPEYGALAAWGRTRSRLLLLLGPQPDGIALSPVNGLFGGAIGPTRLVAIDADGKTRSVVLDRIKSGGSYDSGRPAEAWVPGLAVDPVGERAFVVGGGAPVAEVDLRSLGVAYHELRASTSLWSRMLGWLVPAAAAKGPIAGATREAVWLGDGMLAVAGADVDVVAHQFGIEVNTEPFGLKLIDTRAWTARTLDERATGFAAASNGLLAYAGAYDAQYRATGGIGLTGFARDGTKLFHDFGDAPIFWAKIAGGKAYVAAEGRIVGVDVVSGKVVHALAGPLPEILR